MNKNYTDKDYTKLPRLYSTQRCKSDDTITFDNKQAHYLKNVLRRAPGDRLRIFNGRDGEWLVEITHIDKKICSAKMLERVKDQPVEDSPVHLVFAPLKKNRQDMLIEKAVELGVSEFHPVLTARTEVRKINTQRLSAQIIEAAEQCERMSLPVLHDLKALDKCLVNWADDLPLYAALERGEHTPINNALNKGAGGFLIGPVGGFTDSEYEMIYTAQKTTSISLGNNILRAETASILCLSAHKLLHL